MKITCTYQMLKEAIYAMEVIIQKNPALPILQNILIEAKEGTLFFSATNLEIGVIKELRAKIELEGSISMPLEIVSNFLNALRGDENVTIFTKDLDLCIESGAYKTKIKGFETKDFPIIPQNTEGEHFKLNLEAVKEMLSMTISFVTMNEIRPELTGIFMSFDDTVTAAATDSFRLGEVEISHAAIGLTKKLAIGTIIMPQKLATYINRLPDTIEEIFCSIKDNHLFITCDDTRITARLIDGTYPDYQQIIPKQSKTTIILKKEEFIEAMRVMNVFVGRDGGEIRMKISEEGVFITSRKQEIGESEVMIHASIEGDEQEVIVNPRYILEGLQKITEKEVFVGVTSSLAPIIIQGSNEEGINKRFTYIVMPVKSGNT